MIQALEALLWRLSPHRRRIANKRDLEAVLTHHGIRRKLAERIAGHYFSKARKKGAL